MIDVASLLARCAEEEAYLRTRENMTEERLADFREALTAR